MTIYLAPVICVEMEEDTCPIFEKIDPTKLRKVHGSHLGKGIYPEKIFLYCKIYTPT